MRPTTPWQRALLVMTAEVVVVVSLAEALRDFGLTAAIIGGIGAALWQEWGLPTARRWIMPGAHPYPRGSLLQAGFNASLAALCAGVWATPLLAGWLAVEGLYELWRWWNDDDRRPQRTALRNKVRWRSFTPSPLPSAGGA